MEKKMNRLFSGMLAAVMAVGMLPAFAELDVGDDVEVVDGKGTSQAGIHEAAPAQFSVIVPTKLPFAILANDETLKATNAAIKNNSNGPVTLAGIEAEGKGWAFADYDTVNFNALPMNSKVFIMELNGDKVPAAAVDTKVNVPITRSAWASGAEGSIYGRTELAFSYDGKFAPQADASEEAVVAHVIFTIGWQTADNSSTNDDTGHNDSSDVNADNNTDSDSPVKPSGDFNYNRYSGVYTPIFDGYDPNTMTLSGTLSTNHTGTYSTTITPKDGYTWPDGSTEPKTVNWKLACNEVSPYPTLYDSGRYGYNTTTQEVNVVYPWAGGHVEESGTTSAKKAGRYTATYTLDKWYCWPGGSTKPANINWEIYNR